MLQVGRRLALARRYQQSIGAKEIVLAGNLDMLVPFGANRFRPDRLVICRDATIFLGRRPRSRQRTVDGSDLIDDVGIGLVSVDALLDDSLVVLVQRTARGP